MTRITKSSIGGPRMSRIWTVSYAIILGMVAVHTFWYWNSLNPISSVGQWHSTIESNVPSTQDSAITDTAICPHVLRLVEGGNVQNISNAIEQARDFHQRGGNLKAIQGYLNSYIDETYDSLHMKFTPDGQSDPVKPAHWVTEYLKDHTLPQGGYNRNLPGKFVGPNEHLLHGREVLGGTWRANQKRVTNVLEPFHEQRFQVGMGPMVLNCNSLQQLEEKYLCQGWDNADEECHIFSIGGNNEWSFEGKVIEVAPHCIVHTFDCTLRDYQDHKRENKTTLFVPSNKPQDDRIKFYPVCIGAKAGPDFGTYSDLIKITGIQRAPRILKMDVEGFEFEVLTNLLAENPPDMWPEQIGMEVHWATRMASIPWVFRGLQASEISLFFSMLFTTGGYMPVFREFFPYRGHKSPGCPSCMEVLMVRAVCS